VATLGIVAWKTYWLWKVGPWNFPVSGQTKLPAAVEKSAPDANLLRSVSTEIIISKNLFDPERGAGASRESEANSRAFQRIRGMILLGTAIIGNTRQAILQDGGGGPAAPGNVGQAAGPMRIKQGDLVEGFQLSEVGDKRVIFSKGTSRVELVLDYFRKVEASPGVTTGSPPRGQVRPPTPVAPRVIPALPRRQPGPPSPVPDTNS
jgi:hypothetical protein